MAGDALHCLPQHPAETKGNTNILPSFPHHYYFTFGSAASNFSRFRSRLTTGASVRGAGSSKNGLNSTSKVARPSTLADVAEWADESWQ